MALRGKVGSSGLALVGLLWMTGCPSDEPGPYGTPCTDNSDCVSLLCSGSKVWQEAFVCADPRAYLERYSEPDKTHTGLGASQEAWSAPYWTIDAAFATMIILGAAHDAGLGSLFFALSRGEETLRERCAIPTEVEILGVLALGWPLESQERKGRSASRPRRGASSILRFSAW